MISEMTIANAGRWRNFANMVCERSVMSDSCRKRLLFRVVLQMCSNLFRLDELRIPPCRRREPAESLRERSCRSTSSPFLITKMSSSSFWTTISR